MKMIGLEDVYYVANALQSTKLGYVFVGGSILRLYITDTAAEYPRPTDDVDIALVVSPATYGSWDKVLDILRNAGFKETSGEMHRNRFRLNSLPVDILPTEVIPELTTTNTWYSDGYQNRIKCRLPNFGVEIPILSAPHFIACKLEAALNRGVPDLRLSHDIEDIVYILDGRPELITEIQNSFNNEMRDYIKKTLSAIFLVAPGDEVLRTALLQFRAENRESIIRERIIQITQ